MRSRGLKSPSPLLKLIYSYQGNSQYNAIKTHDICALAIVSAVCPRAQVCVCVCGIILLSGCNTRLLPTVSVPLGSDDSDCTPGTPRLTCWRVC